VRDQEAHASRPGDSDTYVTAERLPSGQSLNSVARVETTILTSHFDQEVHTYLPCGGGTSRWGAANRKRAMAPGLVQLLSSLSLAAGRLAAGFGGNLKGSTNVRNIL
jgi:hypothetical protein